MLLRPRWIAFHVLVLVLVVAMVNLGLWQLRRLDEKRAFNSTVSERILQEAVPLETLVPTGVDYRDKDASEVASLAEWRLVTVSGEYLVDESFRVVNRSQYGRAGDNIVVPLDLGDGRTVLINRGFVPMATTVPPVPAQRVTVVGRVHPSQERSRFGASDPDEGVLTEVQRIDIERLASQTTGNLLPVYVDLVSSSPAELDGLPEPVIQPDLGEGNHLSYAIQWFIFSIAALCGWFVAIRSSLRRARRRSTDQQASPQVASPAPSD